MISTEVLIIGQGIAGSVLSERLKENDIAFHIIDDNHETSCSTIAAGIYHPFVFKTFGFAWKAVTFIPEAINFYTRIEEKYGAKFHYEEFFYRIFKDIEEQNNWYAASGEAAYKSYFNDSTNYPADIQAPYGVGTAKAWRVDLPCFLSQCRCLLVKHGNLTNENFDFGRLNVKNCTYTTLDNTSIVYKKLIFCDGHRFVHNPFFNYLPANLTKGEILHIHSDELHPKGILNKGCFVLSTGKGNYIVGATYDWRNLSNEITKTARNELTTKIREISSAGFEITSQLAGIRPTITDRKPLLGVHPEIPTLYLFNGLGSKGVMTAPKLTEQFFEYVFNGVELPTEVSISRFYKKHFGRWERPGGL